MRRWPGRTDLAGRLAGAEPRKSRERPRGRKAAKGKNKLQRGLGRRDAGQEGAAPHNPSARGSAAGTLPPCAARGAPNPGRGSASGVSRAAGAEHAADASAPVRHPSAARSGHRARATYSRNQIPPAPPGLAWWAATSAGLSSPSRAERAAGASYINLALASAGPVLPQALRFPQQQQLSSTPSHLHSTSSTMVTALGINGYVSAFRSRLLLPVARTRTLTSPPLQLRSHWPPRLPRGCPEPRDQGGRHQRPLHRP